MARATFVKSARKDIYYIGRRVEYVSKKGKQEGQTLSRIDKTLPRDENDKIHIAKGESYYHWTLFRRPTQYSKTPPRQSQLTGSEFLSSIYSLAEDLEDFECDDVEEFESKRRELVYQLEEMRDECQEKLDNMPESLQEAPSGQTLQSRIDGLDEMISSMESLELEEMDEFEFDPEDYDLNEEEQQQKWNEDYQEKINAAIAEMKEIGYEGE